MKRCAGTTVRVSGCALVTSSGSVLAANTSAVHTNHHGQRVLCRCWYHFVGYWLLLRRERVPFSGSEVHFIDTGLTVPGVFPVNEEVRLVSCVRKYVKDQWINGSMSSHPSPLQELRNLKDVAAWLSFENNFRWLRFLWTFSGFVQHCVPNRFACEWFLHVLTPLWQNSGLLWKKKGQDRIAVLPVCLVLSLLVSLVWSG